MKLTAAKIILASYRTYFFDMVGPLMISSHFRFVCFTTYFKRVMRCLSVNLIIHIATAVEIFQSAVCKPTNSYLALYMYFYYYSEIE